MNNCPIRYRISTWLQLPRCLSNNSKDLKIRVTKFVGTEKLSGIRISVDHPAYGTLFSTIVNGGGCLLSKDSSDRYHSFTPTQILAELEKFGFLIEYDPILDIPGDQIEFLLTVNKLRHFDKVRILSVWDSSTGVKQFSDKIVCFHSLSVPNWIQSSYSPSKKEYTDAISSGHAMCLDDVSATNKWSWDFLVNFTANIEDIVYDYTNTQRSGEML